MYTRKALLWPYALLAFLLLVTLIFSPPTRSRYRESSAETRELSHTKQIYIALKMYAGDHDGKFPGQINGEMPLTNANEAFRQLIPEYLPSTHPRSKTIFYSEGSQWTPHPPDDRIIPGKTPMAGENHFAFVPNLTDTDNPSFPLIATGFAKGTPGIYHSQATKTNRFNKQRVVIVRLDGSGKWEPTTPDFRVTDKIGIDEYRDLFKPAPDWLRPDQSPLNPEG